MGKVFWEGLLKKDFFFFLNLGKCYGIRAYGTFMLGFEGFVLLIFFCEREIYTNGMGFTNGIFGVLLSILLFFFERREKILLHWGLVTMGYPTREALVSITYLLSPLEGGMNGNPLSVCNKYCLLLEIACE